MVDDPWRVPSNAEQRAWVMGSQAAALHSYRLRVRPDRGLEAVVVVFEDTTHVGRSFKVIESVCLGSGKD